MVDVIVGVGANINPETNIAAAIGQLRQRFESVSVSTFYTSKPVGRVDQPTFVNGAIVLRSSHSPRELKLAFREIESDLGRIRDPNDKCGPRTIDLDLVAYGDLVDESLEIPDPNLTNRWFVAIPAAELMPEWRHPVHNKTLADIAASMRDLIDGSPATIPS